MKQRLSVGLCFCALILCVSCQKSYNPPGLDLSKRNDTTSSSGSGTLLAKYESKTNGSTEGSSSSYDYDSSKHLLKITEVDTDSSNVSITTVYHFVRDASGKVTSIVTNALSADNPGAGFPDSLTINVHYPTGSSNYDYTTYSVIVSGITYKDSITYSYTGSVITGENEYQAAGTPTYTLASKVQFVYTNGNLTAQKVYDPSTGNFQGTYTYDYDTKVAPLTTGNEAFLTGEDLSYASKNNISKITITDASNATLYAVTYTFQYNASNLPVSGSLVQTPDNKTATLKVSYK